MFEKVRLQHFICVMFAKGWKTKLYELNLDLTQFPNREYL